MPAIAENREQIAALVEGRPPDERVFLNQRGEPLTRFGIYGVLRTSVARASVSVPITALEKDQPAYDSSFDGDSSVACRR